MMLTLMRTSKEAGSIENKFHQLLFLSYTKCSVVNFCLVMHALVKHFGREGHV